MEEGLIPVCFFGSSKRSAELMAELPENLSSLVLASYYRKEFFFYLNWVKMATVALLAA